MAKTPDPTDGHPVTAAPDDPSGTSAPCPHCGSTLEPTPKRRRLCPVCRAPIVPRMVDGRRVLLTEADASALDVERERSTAGSSLLGCVAGLFVAIGAVGAGIGWFVTVAFHVTPPWWVVAVAFVAASVFAAVVFGVMVRFAEDEPDVDEREADRDSIRMVVATIVAGAAVFMVLAALGDALVG